MGKNKQRKNAIWMTDALEASSFSFGYIIVTLMLANSIYYEIKNTYLLLMALGLVVICLLNIVSREKLKK